ncbi:MAG TPA: 3'-5' exonuclease, partial [Bacteroidales bacterium]|nr:3'-5' exonuclease [Bacteroidales bacterium]
IAYFRLTVNNYDEEALRRIINYPHRGIGATTLEKITVAADEYNVHLWNIVNEPHVYNPEVNSPTKTRLQDFASKIKSYTAQIQKMNAYDLAMHIVTTSGMLLALKENIAEKE